MRKLERANVAGRSGARVSGRSGVGPGVSLRLAVLALGALAWACESPTDDDSGPRTIVVSPASATLDALGATESLTAEVRDGRGRLVVGAVVAWTSSEAEVATVSGEGVVTAVGDGVASIRASFGSVSGSAEMTVAQRAVGLEGVAGDRQVGAANEELPQQLLVRALDRLANPVADAAVSFVPTPGSGSADPTEAVTDADGLAATVWTLGAAQGAQALSASISVGPPLLFSATATSVAGLRIELRFIDQPTPIEVQAFDRAVERWADLIPGKLQPIPVQLPAGACGAESPAISRTVNDVLVLVRLDSIDGERGTLGQARVCGIRASSGLPVLSRVALDTADVARLEASGRLVDMILHELAHALGFGTLWRNRGLLANPSLPDSPGSDTHFTGAAAVAAFDALGGTAYTGGEKVPVENAGAAGMRDSHWRGSVLPTELMTSALNATANPLSRITVASLQDLGYQVDQAAADAYQIPLAPLAPVAPSDRPPLVGDDVVPGPVYVLDAVGRIRGVLEE